MTSTSPAVERLLAAVRDLEAAAAENVERSQEIQRRVALLHDRLQAGESVAEIVESEEPPRVVELLSMNMSTLETAGSELRAAQAIALREEGLTLTAIGELFGVTRQRISALLMQRAALEVGPGGWPDSGETT